MSTVTCFICFCLWSPAGRYPGLLWMTWWLWERSKVSVRRGAKMDTFITILKNLKNLKHLRLMLKFSSICKRANNVKPVLHTRWTKEVAQFRKFWITKTLFVLLSGWSRQSSCPLSPASAGQGTVEEPQWSVGLRDHQQGWGHARGVQWQDHCPLLCGVWALWCQKRGGAGSEDDLQKVREGKLDKFSVHQCQAFVRKL